jgi:hypothetical protein
MNRSARRITDERGLLFGGAGPTSNGGPNGTRPLYAHRSTEWNRAASGCINPSRCRSNLAASKKETMWPKRFLWRLQVVIGAVR